MTNSVPRDQTSLKELETRLACQVRTVELLGEIPMALEECQQLGELVGQSLKRNGPTESVRVFQRDYPCSLAVFLVAQGAHGYSEGGYWPGVSQVTGVEIDPNWAIKLGRLFEDILRHLALPLFPDLHARRYVDLILVHGGIPQYCLDDFFDHLLQPATTRSFYSGMSAQELIDEWLHHASGRYWTDKPVLHFLQFGGKVAEDLVERCREMALEYRNSRIVPDAAEIGLPERVVEGYRHWIDKHGPGDEPPPPDAWRLRRPEISVDPPGQGVLLSLPPQQVPATAVNAEVMWRLSSDGREQTIPLRVRRLGFDLKTNDYVLPLSQPAACYAISFLADGEIKRTWRFQGVDGDRPLLVIDADRGTLLSWQRTLPARRLGLLYPAHLELQFEGKAEHLQTWARMPWGWSSYRGETHDYSQASRVLLKDNGRTVFEAELRPDELRQRPALVGGQALTLPEPASQTPIYQGRPPSIRVPLSSGRELAGELARWRVSVRNKWAAVPEFQVTTALADLQADLEYGPGCVDLPLSLACLLGEHPCGNFEVRLRGPLGRDAELPFRIVPHIGIQGLAPFYLPDPQSGPQAITLGIETDAEYAVESQAEGSNCRIEPGSSGPDGRYLHRVVVGPDVVAIDLTIAHKLPSGDTVRVALPVSVPRLRWALALDPDSPSREWSGAAIRCPVEDLLQAGSPCLLVDLPLNDTALCGPLLTLRLIDLNGQELQCSETLTASPKQRQWRFDLSGFFDTIRSSHSPVLRLELCARDLPETEAVSSWPVLSLTRMLVAENVTLKVRRTGKLPTFELRWHEATRLRNRCVRFWPIWRPWDALFERAIPDSAEGVWSFQAPAEQLRSGKYRLEFLISDPWAPQAACMPMKGCPGTADVELISPERQLEWLDARLQGSEPLLRLRQGIDEFIREVKSIEPDFISWYKLRLNDPLVELEAKHGVIVAVDAYLGLLDELLKSSASPQGLNVLFAALAQRKGELTQLAGNPSTYQAWWTTLELSHTQATVALLQGSKERVSPAVANIKGVRNELVAKLAEMSVPAIIAGATFVEELSALRTTIQNTQHNLRNWLSTLENGERQTESDNFDALHLHVERLLEQLRKIAQHGLAHDPESGYYWKRTEQSIAERAKPVESLARHIMAIQAEQTGVAQVRLLEQRFELLLERVAICHDIGKPANGQAGRQWCFEHLDEGTIPQVLALVDLVQEVDAATLRALQLKMFAATRIQRLLDAARQGAVTPEQFNTYLLHLPRSSLLPQATCRQLLTVPNDAVRLHAVQQLLRRGGRDGAEAVLGWVDAASMSDADAIALLSLNLQPALEYLQEQPDRPSTRRLLSALAQSRQDVIRTGVWIHCNLGWGIVTRIEREDTGQLVNWCVAEPSRYRLSVTLRPNLAPEAIRVSLSTSTAEFGDPGQVITCSWCNQFSTRQRVLIRRHTETAHAPRTKREAQERGGGLLKERFEKEVSLPWSVIEFGTKVPPNEMM